MSEYISYTFNHHDPITTNRDRVFPFLVGKHHGDRAEVPIPTISKNAALNDVGIGTLGGAAMGAVGGGYATRGLLSLLGASQKVKNIGTGLGVLGGGLAGAYLGNKEDEYIKGDPIGSKKSETEGRMNKYLYGGLGALGAAGGDLTAYALGEGDNPAFRVLSAVAGAGLGTLGASWLKQGDIRDVYENLSPDKKEVVKKALSGKSPQEKRILFPRILEEAAKDPTWFDKAKSFIETRLTGEKPAEGTGKGETPVPYSKFWVGDVADLVAPKGELSPGGLAAATGLGGFAAWNWGSPIVNKFRYGTAYPAVPELIKDRVTHGVLPHRIRSLAGSLGAGTHIGANEALLWKLQKAVSDLSGRYHQPTDEVIEKTLIDAGLKGDQFKDLRDSIGSRILTAYDTKGNPKLLHKRVSDLTSEALEKATWLRKINAIDKLIRELRAARLLRMRRVR